MNEQFIYACGIFIAGLVWGGAWLWRKDARRAMVLTGLLHVVVGLLLFAAHRLAHELIPFSPLYNPGYWQVRTLGNLSAVTGGLSLEDALLMFFASGLAAAIFRLRLPRRPDLRLGTACVSLTTLALAYLLLGALLRPNPMLLLSGSTLLAGLALLALRRDLIPASLLTAGLLALVYFLGFVAFTLVFPGFVDQYFNRANLVGVIVLTVPLEEILYAFTLGLLWGPVSLVVSSDQRGGEGTAS